MRGRAIAIIASALLLTTAIPTLSSASSDDTHVVCTGLGQDNACEFTTIQDAVDAASEGDTIEILPGTYDGPVKIVRTDELTIQGAGQNVTVLDGQNLATNTSGITIFSDGVTVRDLTVQNFVGQGVYYDGVTGFYVERVTAINNTNKYGIYAIRSEMGWIRDSFATEHPDSGFYIGETLACECVLENLVAKGNLIGYSGTAASHVTIRDSIFKHNAEGIVPNVLPGEPLPQTNLVVVNNTIKDNNNYTATGKWHFNDVHVPAGVGVTIAGGSNNLVTENTITGHDLAGVAVTWLFAEPSLNRIIDNTMENGADDAVSQNGSLPAEIFEDDGVDILWDGGGVNNCFEANDPISGNITFDAGNSVWDAAGTLPNCSTPNAGAPTPFALGRQLSLMVYACEPGDHLASSNTCHQELV